MMKTISVVGLGKLGCCMAVHFASRGFDVIGVDTNPEILISLGKGKSPIYEPGVQELLDKYKDRIMLSGDVQSATENSEATFIIVPTPSLQNGEFSSKYVESACREIASGLYRRKSYHLIVVTSTVFPGTMAKKILPLLEKESGKKCGKDFGLCYSPEFIALGNVLQGMAEPDAVLIGESDKKAGDMLVKIYQKVCTTNHITRMSFWNAEVAKLALNVYVTMKISYVNGLSGLCEVFPSGNIDAITDFLGFDSRIGHKFLKGGLGFGGTCFPRDTRAYKALVRQSGFEARLPKAVDDVNKSLNSRIVDRIENILGGINERKIAVLGLTYKPNTNVAEESASLGLANLLKMMGADVVAYDPSGCEPNKELKYTKSALDCIKDANLCILATPWEEFKKITPNDFKTLMTTPRIFDCWRFYEREKYSNGIEYYAIGINEGGDMK
jgi:UDPglucose 6-dehydrogenase